ncbi:MAG: hypothetical protein ACXWMN_02860 [Candidatus Limnocylindria bacterium]
MDVVQLREEGGHLGLEGVDARLDSGHGTLARGHVCGDLGIERRVARRDLRRCLVANPLDLAQLPCGDRPDVGVSELVKLGGTLLGLGADARRSLSYRSSELSQGIVARLLGDLAHRIHEALEEGHCGLARGVVHRFG